MDYVAPPSDSDALTSWAIAGIAIGSCAAIMLVVVLMGYFYYQARFPLSKEQSEMLGVSLDYLLDSLVDDAEEAARKTIQNPDRYKSMLATHINPTFYDIKVCPL